MADKSHRARNCCCCLFGVLWKLLVAIIILAGLAVLIFWLVVQPRSFKFYVSEAKLTQFDYANNTLRYDLALNFTARNPNKKLSIYYDKVEGRAFYQGQRFGTADVITFQNSFRQYKKSTDPMRRMDPLQCLGAQHRVLCSKAQRDQATDLQSVAWSLCARGAVPRAPQRIRFLP